jgi:hypothetical protein
VRPQIPAVPAPGPASTSSGATAAPDDVGDEQPSTGAPGSPARSGNADSDQGSAGNGSGGSGESGNADRCTTAELRGSVRDGDAATGHRHKDVLLTSTGARSCALRGFPGVSYVAGDDGRQVGPSAAMVGGYGDPVVIAPGQAVAAPISETVAEMFDPSACMPTAVRGLRIYPPGDTAALYIPDPGTGCAGDSPGPQITVKHVRPA